MDDDVEPERYYEWILWKLRKEKNMTIEYTIQKEKSETFALFSIENPLVGLRFGNA